MEPIAIQIFASVVASTLVGMGAAYMTAVKAISGLRERVKSLEQKADSASDLSERMVRLETKIDMLLGGQLKQRNDRE